MIVAVPMQKINKITRANRITYFTKSAFLSYETGEYAMKSYQKSYKIIIGSLSVLLSVIACYFLLWTYIGTKEVLYLVGFVITIPLIWVAAFVYYRRTVKKLKELDKTTKTTRYP